MRSSSLLEQIIAEAQQSPLKKDINRAAVLALRGDIKAALEQGWSMKKIWKVLHARGSIAFSYQAFTVYVNRLILNDKQQASPILKKALSPSDKVTHNPRNRPEPVTSPASAATNDIKSFVYEPILLTKEDL